MPTRGALALASHALSLLWVISLTLPTSAGAQAAPSWPAGLPVYDHIVVVIEENKDYEEIIGNPAAKYINDVLKAEGASFTRMYGEEHNSQGNYFWLFSCSNQSVGFSDIVPNSSSSGYPFTASSLGEQLIKRGLTFKGYSEGLPSIGFTGTLAPPDCGGDACVYARKHVPWISFKNVPNGKTAATSSNLRFQDFPTDASQFSKLPTVAFVVPNLRNDMHNGTPEESIPRGDEWLRDKIDPYYRWAKNHNSLLILTFDENSARGHFKGLTDPCLELGDITNTGHPAGHDEQNRIVTIFAGAAIKHGEYSERATHVNVLRMLEAMYGLPKSGSQQPKAAACGISDDPITSDIFIR
jgi:phosphatidylinositol-3-phosphatase